MKITPELIRMYFGDDAKIERRFLGGYRVTTWTGGDVDIDSNGDMHPHAGGDDVYEAVIRLASHGGNAVTASGPSEHITAAMSHGIANDVVVIPEVKKGGGCLRFLVVAFVFMIVLSLAGSGTGQVSSLIGMVIAIAVSRWVWVSMKKRQQRAERQGRASLPLSIRAHAGRAARCRAP